MSLLRPYKTLAVGIVVGMFVVPIVTRKLGVTVPGA